MACPAPRVHQPIMSSRLPPVVSLPAIPHAHIILQFMLPNALYILPGSGRLANQVCTITPSGYHRPVDFYSREALPAGHSRLRR